MPDLNDQTEDSLSEIYKNANSEYDAKLKELSLFFGEVFKDAEARKELKGFSLIEENQGEVSLSLRELFENQESEGFRKKSAIVDAFYSHFSSRSFENENVEDLVNFIKSNDLGIVAPYLAENFEIESLDKLTVSWWTQEYENWNLSLDSNWVGYTKAINLDLTKSGDQFGGEILVSDDYAKKNPTIVLGAFDYLDEPLSKEKSLELGVANASTQSIVNSANCSQLDQFSVVKLKMPEFKLTSSIRSWPHPDRINIVVVLGTNPGGNAQSNTVLFEKEVKRKNAGKWLDSNISFLINNWLDRQIDMKLLVFNRRPSNSDTETVSVNIKTNSNGDTETQTAVVGGWSLTQLHFSQTFNKCGTINDPFSDNGFGLRSYSGVNYGVERFNKFMFYLVPEIQL